MKGLCLCESVTIEANAVSDFEACHCSMCRRWGEVLFWLYIVIQVCPFLAMNLSRFLILLIGQSEGFAAIAERTCITT